MNYRIRDVYGAENREWSDLGVKLQPQPNPIHAIVTPKLEEVLYKVSLPPDSILKKNSTVDDIEQLLDSIPTANVRVAIRLSPLNSLG